MKFKRPRCPVTGKDGKFPTRINNTETGQQGRVRFLDEITTLSQFAMMKDFPMVDMTEQEMDGINEAKRKAAEFLQGSGLMAKPLGYFTQEEVGQFLEVIVGGYLEGLAESGGAPF